MPLYLYSAFSKLGKKKRGRMDATSMADARRKLASSGLFPIEIALATAANRGFSIRDVFSRSVPAKQKILFTKQLAVLLKAGVPLLQAFELLTGQMEGLLSRIIIDLRDGLKEGQSLASGLEQYPRVFENIYVQLVRAGEASGSLDLILSRLVTYLEKQQEMRKRVGSAMRGPMIQLGVIGIAVVVLLTFVVPKIAGVFAGAGKELPGTTQFLLVVSGFFVSYYWLLAPALVGLYIAYRWWKSTPAGGLMVDKVKLRIPMVRFFTRIGAVVQFSKTLGMLLESGVNLAEALDIVVRIVDNQVLAQQVGEARDNIVKEGKIAQFLGESGVFPPFAMYLIRTGEESGQLAEMLNTVAKNYEVDLTEFADGLAEKIQPLMMILMALIVGFISIAIMQPLVGMNDAIAGG
jgi:type II secretory pathway component PulF